MDAFRSQADGAAREKRLQYFLENYLPKNEVLYRLPLDISIESFWEELVRRRKAGAVILPLENAAGMPYWYTLTDKMIRASRKICDEALSDGGAFDPYRMQMTSAMTQEMYFTSFVEGAQISLEDSMDFLGSGLEPSNIYEQMIWNNKQAWELMCRNLYRPMDEEYLKYMAWCLTDGMENSAEDYRQMDTHPIAAMGTETYRVPPAGRIPDMMRRYCAFLMNPGIHPLIKASAGAAYLLVTRPFPEGNERLSRMLPAAILFRSGYDIFKDISLSGVIARENYLYYKGMCDIIRDESGDLTYFMEYFLDMLARALDRLHDRERKRREDADRELAEKEHEMALVPLGTADLAVTASSDNPVKATDSSIDIAQEIYENPLEGKPPEKKADSGKEGTRLPDPGEFLFALKQAENSGSERLVRAIPFVQHLVTENENIFTRKELQEKLGLSESTAYSYVVTLTEAGFIEKIPVSNKKDSKYILKYNVLNEEKTMADAAETAGIMRWRSKQDLLEFIETGPGYLPRWMIPIFREMLSQRSINKFRVVQFLINALREGTDTFTLMPWMKKLGLTKYKMLEDVRVAMKYGLVSRHGANSETFYKISMDQETAQALRLSKQEEEQAAGVIQEKTFIETQAKNITEAECGKATGVSADNADFQYQRMIDGRREESEIQDTVDMSEEADEVRSRLLKNATGNPDIADYWALPGDEIQEETLLLPAASAG